MQSKSDMSDSQHMQYCLAQRSCTVSTNLAAHPLHMHFNLSFQRSLSSPWAHPAHPESTCGNGSTGESMPGMLFLREIALSMQWYDTPCIKQDVLYHMGSLALSDIYFCDHSTLCLPRRGQRSTSVYAHESGGQKTLCDYLIFNQVATIALLPLSSLCKLSYKATGWLYWSFGI